MRTFVLMATGLAALAVVASGFVATTMVYCAKVIKDGDDKPVSICTGEWAINGLIYPLGIAIAVLFVGSILLTVMRVAKPVPRSNPMPLTASHEPYRQASRLDPEAVRYAGMYTHRIVRTICWSPLPIVLVTSVFAYLSIDTLAPELKGIVGGGGVLGEIIKQGMQKLMENVF